MDTFNHIGITGNHREKSVARTVKKIVHLLKIFQKDYLLD